MISPILSFILNQNETQTNCTDSITTENHYTENKVPSSTNFTDLNYTPSVTKGFNQQIPVIRKRRISCQPDVPYSNLSDDKHQESPNTLQFKNNFQTPANIMNNNSFDSSCNIKTRDDGVFSIISLLNQHQMDNRFRNGMTNCYSNCWDENNEDRSPDTLIPFLRNRHVSNSSPSFPIKVKTASSMTFDEVCENPCITINPKRFGFIPSFLWSDEIIKFGLLVTTFFRKRNMASSKFPHKLYNALRISECYPDLINHIGIQWVTNDVFRVDRAAFARLLGVKSIEGGLFHQQGNFPSHGFVELDFQECESISLSCGLGHADLSQVRFLKSSHGNFNRYSTERDISNFRWSSRPAQYDM
ncbi:hypothetical protein M9Y10_033733 [Tritrichomonas musculus]|uniref:Initiator binding domain-containing protein n=1 Tax=Tritrichomonas musculus TaxID=1915356 RepID=A0ABR2KEX8_9EUKA